MIDPVRYPVAALAKALPQFSTGAILKAANLMTPEALQDVLQGLSRGEIVRHSKGRLTLCPAPGRRSHPTDQ